MSPVTFFLQFLTNDLHTYFFIYPKHRCCVSIVNYHTKICTFWPYNSIFVLDVYFITLYICTIIFLVQKKKQLAPCKKGRRKYINVKSIDTCWDDYNSNVFLWKKKCSEKKKRCSKNIPFFAAEIVHHSYEIDGCMDEMFKASSTNKRLLRQSISVVERLESSFLASKST